VTNDRIEVLGLGLRGHMVTHVAVALLVASRRLAEETQVIDLQGGPITDALERVKAERERAAEEWPMRGPTPRWVYEDLERRAPPYLLREWGEPLPKFEVPVAAVAGPPRGWFHAGVMGEPPPPRDPSTHNRATYRAALSEYKRGQRARRRIL
jgi:hypothetical protein